MQDDKAGGGILYHEDIEVGTPLMLGGTTVTKDAIIAFAQAYDPQPIHLDEEAAKHSLVGGLCASGYHTCALMMRMVVDGFLGRAASQGSPGVDEVRWLKPVRPGGRYARASHLWRSACWARGPMSASPRCWSS